MSRRSRAREIVLQVLYQDEFGGSADDTRDIEFLRGRLKPSDDLVAFAQELLVGVRRQRVQIDALLRRWSEHWDLSRMAIVDRNILRLGAFEIVFLGTPKPVVVNEAVVLAKRYGNQQSFQFINGILDRLSAEDAAANTGN